MAVPATPTEPTTWPTYTDANGREWLITLDVQKIKMLREDPDLKLDLLAIFEPEDKTLQRLATDTILLVDTISVLLTEEIEKRGMDAESFAQSLVGDAIDRATDALIQAIGFFSRKHQRQLLTSLWEQQQGLERVSLQKIQEAAPQIAAAASNKINQAISQVLTDLNSDPIGQPSGN